jgi:hypothetical protein
MTALINVSDLTDYISSHGPTKAWAKPMKDVGGYCLFVMVGNEERVLSTYLAHNPRLFKRADALLKEAGKMGLAEVSFKISEDT